MKTMSEVWWSDADSNSLSCWHRWSQNLCKMLSCQSLEISLCNQRFVSIPSSNLGNPWEANNRFKAVTCHCRHSLTVRCWHDKIYVWSRKWGKEDKGTCRKQFMELREQFAGYNITELNNTTHTKKWKLLLFDKFQT